jgi:hypothetical protein
MHLKIRQLFVILLFLGIFLMTLRPIADPDFWWHLRTGQVIFQNQAIPHSDPFSFTNNGKPWIAHEWLTELLFYGFYQIGRYGLLILVFSLIITGAFFLAYLRCSSDSKPYIAGFSLFLGVISTAPTWGVRPQMISLFLSSLFLYLLDRYKKNQKLSSIIPLPILTMLWVNLHGGYFLGLVIIAIYIAGALIELLISTYWKKTTSSSLNIKSIVCLSIVLIISILVTLVNPNGIHILSYPFQTLTSQAMQQFIQEWFSPDFHNLEWQPLAWFILALIAAGMIGKRQFNPTRVILIIVLGYATLRSVRFIPLFAIAASPILADQLGWMVKTSSISKPFDQLIKWLNPLLLTIFVIIVGIRFIQVVKEQPRSIEKNFPKSAVDWIEENQPQGNLFNSYGWGGYILWRLFPQKLVYIDGRADVYGDDFIYEYINVYRAQPGWETILDSQEIQLVLVEPGSNLANSLSQSPAWEDKYDDSISIIFVRR